MKTGLEDQIKAVEKRHKIYDNKTKADENNFDLSGLTASDIQQTIEKMGLSAGSSEKEVLNLLRARNGATPQAGESTQKAETSKNTIIAGKKETPKNDEQQQKPASAAGDANSLQGATASQGVAPTTNQKHQQ